MANVTTTEILPPSLPRGRSNLVLTGFSGAGKTTVGRAVADRLGLPFVDLDEVVATRAAMSVEQIFERGGEAGFRSLERAALADAAKLSACVVATGGGAVTNREEFARLADGSVVVVLHCELEETERRLARSHPRPLLQVGQTQGLEALMGERSAAYAEVGSVVETTGRDVGVVATEVAGLYHASQPPGPASIRVSDGQTSYPVVVGRSALLGLGASLGAEMPTASRVVLIADSKVADTAGTAAAAALRQQGLKVARLAVPAGEAAKRIEVVAWLWERLAGLGADRHDVVVAVGGGGALDAIGFAAATFARGLPLVNVPTTLLAMADAAIGGKVAIDHAGTKNSVGSFHQPRLVVADPEVLATLPDQILRQGVPEIVKSGVLGSPLMLELSRQYLGDGSHRDWSWLVEQSVRIKAGYVAADSADLGPRQALNLGHTFAHGLEAASAYTLSHGEAVAVGLVAAADLGHRLGISPEPLSSELAELLAAFGLPCRIPSGLDPARIRQAIAGDKKRRAGRSVFVIPRRDGGAHLVAGLDTDWALRSLWNAAGAETTAVDDGITPDKEGWA
ncbi:MAG: bifunctional shikimate kinase/3-dehydroquinate synthase [Candidatus Dormibacteria bacterium]